MLTLSKRNLMLIGLMLVALIVANRGHHYPTVRHMLPSASWAVFFLTGVYLRPVLVLPGLLLLAGTAFAATAVCEFISSGRFYFFSGRFTDRSLVEFSGRLANYFSHSITSLAIWVAVAALVHASIAAARGTQATA